MQSVAVISCKVPGLIYLNGRFAGECAPDAPYMTPVSPRGALYLEHRPLARGYAPVAHRVAFASGALIAESVPKGVFAVKWPGGIAELELLELPLAQPESDFSNVDGIPAAILRGEMTVLRVAGHELKLPSGARLPTSHAAIGPAFGFSGEVPGAQYLACFAAGSYAPLDTVLADEIEIEGEARIRALTRLKDTVGHARIELWEAREDAINSLDVEYAWADGSPAWPQNAEDTALAALEAAFLGLNSEAEGYLIPRMRGTGLLERLIEDADACVKLKYAIPDSRPAVGLLRRETDRCAVVTPAFYRASPMGGAQGPWALEALDKA